ncbi:MAG TPA: DUF6114 domain-containing protein [Actinocrinis sp.]|nr:DUF6114 domain-containing protein [Actinocrinis sp.]
MTTIASEHNPERSVGSALNRARLSFRAWRRGRPFWGGLSVILGGLEIIWIPYSPIGVVVHEGIAGVGGMFIGALMIMFGLSAVSAPAYRVFAGIASVLLSLVALPATNLGGFLIGTLCGLFGGSFAVAWTPRPGLVADTWMQRRTARKNTAQAEAAQSVAYGSGTFGATHTDIAQSGPPLYPDTAQHPDTMESTVAEPSRTGFTEAEIEAAEAAAAESTQTPVTPED